MGVGPQIICIGMAVRFLLVKRVASDCENCDECWRVTDEYLDKDRLQNSLRTGDFGNVRCPAWVMCLVDTAHIALMNPSQHEHSHSCKFPGATKWQAQKHWLHTEHRGTFSSQEDKSQVQFPYSVPACTACVAAQWHTEQSYQLLRMNIQSTQNTKRLLGKCTARVQNMIWVQCWNICVPASWYHPGLLQMAKWYAAVKLYTSAM